MAVPAPFHTLARRGQLLRLRALALAALERYDISPVGLRVLAHDNNTLFRVDQGEEGYPRNLVLRISRPRPALQERLRAETTLLSELRRDLRGPEVHPNDAGEYVTTVSVPGVPEPRHCVVFGWLPGRDLSEVPTPDNVLEWGRLLATLHEVALDFDHTRFDLPRHTDVYEGYPEVLHDHPELADPAQVARIRDAAEAILAAAPGPPRIIHGDLHPWNVRMYRGWPHALDFEHVSIGTPLQDLGISAHYLTRLATPIAGLAQFRAGYEQILPWPAPDLTTVPTLAAARALTLLNEIVQHPDADVRVYAVALAVRFRDLAARV